MRGGVRLSSPGRWRRRRRTPGGPAGPSASPVHLRRPMTHRNPGVTGRGARAGATRHRAGRYGEERRAGRGGGARLSGCRGGCGVRAFVRRAMVRHVGRWDSAAAGIVTAILIGDRAGLDGRRRAVAAGGRHVSRHRDLRRQHRHLRSADAGAVPLGRTAGADGHGDRHRRCSSSTARWSTAAHRSTARSPWRSLYFAARALDQRVHAAARLLVAAGGARRRRSARGLRSGVPAVVRRHARHSRGGSAACRGPPRSPLVRTLGGDAGGVGGGGSCPAADRRVRLRSRHVRRARC